MAAKAHEISLEAGSKMASAMRDVIGAAAGLTAFAIESARDLVQYMVRRGQMSQDEADKLMREVEEAHAHRAKTAPKVEKVVPPVAQKVEKAAVKPEAAPMAHPRVADHTPAVKAEPAKVAHKVEPVKAAHKPEPPKAAAKHDPPKAAHKPAPAKVVKKAAAHAAPAKKAAAPVKKAAPTAKSAKKVTKKK
jgi:polyhydroxyalkanoate synthesis regulator phasin